MRMGRWACVVAALLVVAAAVVMIPVGVAQQGPLQINRAYYGKNGAGRDVTKRLRVMVQGGTIDVKISNDNMGGDPAKGADKSVKVDYTYRGRRSTVVVKEGDRLKLP